MYYKCEICSKLKIKAPERFEWLNFEQISHNLLVFFIVNFEEDLLHTRKDLLVLSQTYKH